MKIATTLLLLAPAFAQSADLSGDWMLTITRFGQPDYVRWKLDRTMAITSANSGASRLTVL